MLCIKLIDHRQIYNNLQTKGTENGFFSAECRAIDCGRNALTELLNLFLLQEDKNQQLCSDDPEKHSQRIYGGIAHGGYIIPGSSVGI